MVNIILDGCDCTGKTSIVKELNKNNEYKVIHCTNPSSYEDGKEQYFEIVDMLNTNDNLIFDRAMLSETVYAPIFRGYYPDYMRELENKINANNFLFLIEADTETIKQRFDGKFIRLEHIDLIKERFREELKNSNYINKYIIDTTNITPEQAAESIKKIIKEINHV